MVGENKITTPHPFLRVTVHHTVRCRGVNAEEIFLFLLSGGKLSAAAVGVNTEEIFPLLSGGKLSAAAVGVNTEEIFPLLSGGKLSAAAVGVNTEEIFPLLSGGKLSTAAVGVNAEVISLFNFCTSFSTPSNVIVHGISRTPWCKSAEYRLLPVVWIVTTPFLRKNKEQTEDIILGTCPTVMPLFMIATAKGSDLLPLSS